MSDALEKLSDLDLLAGPIVRRAEPECVWIWFATRPQIASFEAKIQCRTLTGDLLTRLFVPRNRNFLSVKLGHNLHISLLPLRPTRRFKSDEVYVYNFGLRFVEMDEALPTRWLNAYYPNGELCYKPFDGPTFRIASSRRPIAHGSCRRPGAKGQDSFLALDHRLAADAQSWMFPQALFLTGDQIYADDVVQSLFDAIGELAPPLLAVVEYLPVAATSYNLKLLDGLYERPSTHGAVTRVNHYRYTKREEKARPPAATRRGLCFNVAKFTTGDGEGHLLGLAEYAAMYLLVWSGELCRRFNVEGRASGEFAKGDPFLENFTAACRAAQRVLANLPTYMIFDDHDVTDDWNIDSYFEEDTRRGNPTGSRIVANAIAAYWAFQGWGNDPDDRRYDTNYIRTVQDHVDGMIATNGLSDSRAAGEASGAFARQFLQQRNFGFVAPTEPKALFIDTRTQRKHARGARAPVLLPHDALMAIAHTLDRQFKWGGDLIAVLPCPVMPASVALGGHQWKLRGGTRELAIEWDAEQFWNHPDGPFGLIHMIATWCNPAHCFIFSGDVHHGYVIRAVFKNFDDPKRYRDYYQRGGFLWAMTGASFPAIDKELAIPADITLTAIQITSSPIKNYQDAFESGSSRQIEKMGFNSDPNSSSVYSLGEHLIGARRMVFACRYKAVGGYLQFQVETDVVDKKGTRPYSAMDRAIGAPHFCIFHRADPADGNLSRAVVEFIGLRRPKRGDDDYWSSQCVVDLKEFSPRS